MQLILLAVGNDPSSEKGQGDQVNADDCSEVNNHPWKKVVSPKVKIICVKFRTCCLFKLLTVANEVN